MPKIYPAADEAKIILEAAAEHTGWGLESMLDVICDYVNEHHGTNKLLIYVQDLVNEECETEEIDV